MQVYRLSSKDEVERILNTHSFEGLGKECTPNPKLNNHNYQSNTRYIHFFKDFSSIFYLYPDENKFICTYDFPEEILSGTKGEGKYLDYLFFRNLQTTSEYAIPESNVNFSHLRQISRINRELEVEDYIADKTLSTLTTSIYDATESSKAQEK